MRRCLCVGLCVALIVADVGCSKEETKKQPRSTTPLASALQAPKIVIAATAAVKIEPPFQVRSDPAAVGGQYIVAPKNQKEKNKACVAVYEFTVPKTDTYYLWIRKNWAGGCSNSLFVKIDDHPEFIFGEDGTYERWDWTNAIGKSFNLAAGKHTLVIKNREDDSKFDQILLIADKDYVPQGIEGQ